MEKLGKFALDSSAVQPGEGSCRHHDVRPELELGQVPERIIHIVERLTAGRRWGLCDPMYMANRVAVKFGWGDGRSSFDSTNEMPSTQTLKEFAKEIRASYWSVFNELGVDENGVLGRVVSGLEEAQSQINPMSERP